MTAHTIAEEPEQPEQTLEGGDKALALTTPDVSELFKVYKPPLDEASGSKPLPELTDADFQPTTAELKSAYEGQARKLDQAVNAPFKSEAIRQREQAAKANRWPKTTIRVKFSDQTVLERTFDSTEKIKAVYQFVRSALIEEALGDKFVLYQAPRRELKVSDPDVKTQSLAQLGLAPSSALLIRFQSDAYNSSTLPPPLLPQIIKQAVPLPTPPPQIEAPKATSSTPSKSISGPKVPKWFKMGQPKKK